MSSSLACGLSWRPAGKGDGSGRTAAFRGGLGTPEVVGWADPSDASFQGAQPPPSALSRTLPNPATPTGLAGETRPHPHRLQVTGEPGPQPGCRRQTLHDQAGGRSRSWQRPRPPRGTVCPGGSVLPQAARWSQEGGAAQASWLLPRPLSRPRKAFWWGQEAAQAQCWLITRRRLSPPPPAPATEGRIELRPNTARAPSTGR